MNPGYLEFSHWNEPKMLAKVLLDYFIHNSNQVDLLFHLIKAFCFRFICDFQVCSNNSIFYVLLNYILNLLLFFDTLINLSIVFD